MPGSLRGREIRPDSREYQWVASIVAAVEQRTGKPSTWNRRLYEEHNGTGATAQHNGPMTGYQAGEELRSGSSKELRCPYDRGGPR